MCHGRHLLFLWSYITHAAQWHLSRGEWVVPYWNGWVGSSNSNTQSLSKMAGCWTVPLPGRTTHKKGIGSSACENDGSVVQNWWKAYQMTYVLDKNQLSLSQRMGGNMPLELQLLTFEKSLSWHFHVCYLNMCHLPRAGCYVNFSELSTF